VSLPGTRLTPAFTLPLPLFPRLIAWYLEREAHSPSTLLARLLKLSYSWRGYLTTLSGAVDTRTIAPEIRWGKAAADTMSKGKNWDVVLLGGAMGSLFSLCQCIISPYLGKRKSRSGHAEGSIRPVRPKTSAARNDDGQYRIRGHLAEVHDICECCDDCADGRAHISCLDWWAACLKATSRSARRSFQT
jgi:hypothetical protein